MELVNLQSNVRINGTLIGSQNVSLSKSDAKREISNRVLDYHIVSAERTVQKG